MTRMHRMLSQARLDRSQPMREQIYALVRNLILTGKIAPRQIIDEKQIAALLDVSRTPVREAVKKLSDEHLVTVVAQSATRAAAIDRHEVEQAYIIRRALEMECAGQAAQRMTSAHAETLDDIVRHHERALARKDYEKALTADDSFHRAIAEIAGLPRLWRAVEISKAHLDRCRLMMLPRPGEAETTLVHHRRIIRALKSKNPAKASAAMAAHLKRSYVTADRALVEESSDPRQPLQQQRHRLRAGIDNARKLLG